MMLRKHHKLALGLVVLFVLAWALWTFIWLPASETPSMPDPAAAAPVN